jgi:UDP-glucose 4-epimerase
VETKRVLVTGGAGFMGSWLVDELVKRGHEVTSVDCLLGGYKRNINKNCTFVNLDLRNKEKVNRVVKNIHVIFHLAAYAAEGQSIFSPIEINDVNITPMNVLLVAAVNHGVERFVFTSSMAVYGRQIPPFNEDMPRQPVDPYGVGKAYCETMLEIFAKTYNFEYCVIRPHNVYGPRQNIYDPYRNVLGIWINSILRGQSPHIYGDGEQRRAFSYIEDVTSAIANASFVKKANGQIINVGSDEVVTINEACKKVLRIMSVNLKPIHVEERPGEVKNAYCTVDKSIKILGYRTTHMLDDGIANMVEWAKKIGPQKPVYRLPLEITKKAPRVWVEKLI